MENRIWGRSLTFIVALTIPALAPVVAITGIPAIVGIGLLAGGALGYMGGAALGGTDKKIIESIVTKKEKHQKEIESPDFAKEICDEFVKVADQTIGKLAIQQAVGPDVIERDFYYHLSSTLAGGSTAKGSQYISVEQKTTNFTGETLSQLIKKAHDADKRTTPLSIDRERPSTTQTRTRKIANRISKLIANAGVPEDSPLSELSTLAAELKDLQKTGRENRNRRENQKPSIHQNF